jgi:hypothetical protein
MVVTLSTGVQIEVKSVPRFALMNIQNKLAGERPKVPIVHIKEDDRDIEVPENPDYQRDLLAYQGKMVEATYDAMIVLGTKVVQVPESVQKPEDTGWAEDLKLVGIDVPVNGKGRYLSWMKLYACAQDADMGLITKAISGCMGITEEEAAKAATLFRSPT